MIRTVTIVPPIDGRSGDVTLLFTLGAARTFADPATVFDDARRWSRFVGVIANDTAAVDAFVRRHGVENDFELRDWDKWGTMAAILEATDTPRHVLVGTKRPDRRLASTVGWEYRTAREAAEKAGWERDDPLPDGSDLDDSAPGDPPSGDASSDDSRPDTGGDGDTRDGRRLGQILDDRWFWPF